MQSSQLECWTRPWFRPIRIITTLAAISKLVFYSEEMNSIFRRIMWAMVLAVTTKQEGILITTTTNKTALQCSTVSVSSWSPPVSAGSSFRPPASTCWMQLVRRSLHQMTKSVFTAHSSAKTTPSRIPPQTPQRRRTSSPLPSASTPPLRMTRSRRWYATASRSRRLHSCAPFRRMQFPIFTQWRTTRWSKMTWTRERRKLNSNFKIRNNINNSNNQRTHHHHHHHRYWRKPLATSFVADSWRSPRPRDSAVWRDASLGGMSSSAKSAPSSTQSSWTAPSWATSAPCEGAWWDPRRQCRRRRSTRARSCAVPRLSTYRSRSRGERTKGKKELRC